MFRSCDHQTSVALDGNPEPDLVHATGCKQLTLRLIFIYLFDCLFAYLFILVLVYLATLSIAVCPISGKNNSEGMRKEAVLS
jgi:hypothetical protein